MVVRVASASMVGRTTTLNTVGSIDKCLQVTEMSFEDLNLVSSGVSTNRN